MRDRMERLVLLPFAVGCMSESSVGVASPPARRSARAPGLRSPPIKREESDEETSSEEGTKNSASSLALPKPNISTGIHKMFKGFKNFSHLFVYKEDMEEEEMEIQIGLPTDVKHVTHIGWDGCAANPDLPMKAHTWDSFFIDPALLQNSDLCEHIPSPFPTACGLEQLESRSESKQDAKTANMEPHSDPVPLKG
ncbi:CRIB domain-containing protein RIC4 isoform X2 [Punica granatum]|uniref:CRIB domain-containing protein RIC4 isoform X2 n=3 Tax=Punica granatum TaxID=22663 RepID=A0A6P8C4B5_PUNGR|nr:CRIB domain-containing protein RIC4 isoform X2 [Punica granatum]PKI55472.1 hypothetical protein CRG98_024084 [Punica granatum]